jgi:hypothetical protein
MKKLELLFKDNDATSCKKAAILQSNYIPWKGYFDIIHDVDLFIFYDDVQYTKNDWRNRNKIKTPAGVKWLTVPTGSSLNRLTCEVKLTTPTWQKKHWKTIQQYYGKSPFFSLYKEFFQEVYLGQQWNGLSELNQFLIQHIANDFLGIKTQFTDSRQYGGSQYTKTERLINLLVKTNAQVYVSGPAAKDYLDENLFKQNNISLIYKNYSNYPIYQQLYPPFTHEVSIIDLLFSCGTDAPYYIWG